MINHSLYSLIFLAMSVATTSCSDGSFTGSNGTQFQAAKGGKAGGSDDANIGGGSGDATDGGPAGGGIDGGTGGPGDLFTDGGSDENKEFLPITILFTANIDDSKRDWGDAQITITNSNFPEKSVSYTYTIKTNTVTAEDMCPRVGDCSLSFTFKTKKVSGSESDSNVMKQTADRASDIASNEVAIGIRDGDGFLDGLFANETDYHNWDDILFKVTHSDSKKKVLFNNATKMGPSSSCTWSDWVNDKKTTCGGM